MPGLEGGREEGPALGSCRKCQRQNKPHYCVRVDLVAYLNTASGGVGIADRDGAGLWSENAHP